MTKYILNSGGLRKYPDLARKFYAEIVEGLGERPRVLICFFAEPREKWENKFIECSDSFRLMSPADVRPSFDLALPDSFLEQVANTDALYIYGGDNHLLRYWFEKLDIPRIWENKVVATNSASSMILSQCA